MLVKRKWEAEDRQAAMDAEQARIDAEAAEAKKSLLRQVPSSTSASSHPLFARIQPTNLTLPLPSDTHE